MFKKIIFFTMFIGYLFAYDYNYGSNGSDNYSNDSYKSTPSRGSEQPGDENYNNMKVDEYIYGKNNSFQGSRPGDDDYSDRQMNYLMNGK